MAAHPKKKKGSPVFGVSLEEVLQTYSQDTNSLPFFVNEITSFLKRHGAPDILHSPSVFYQMILFPILFAFVERLKSQCSNGPFLCALLCPPRSWLRVHLYEERQ